MEYLLSDLAEKETGTQLAIDDGEPTGFVVDKIHSSIRYPPRRKSTP